MRNFRFGVNLVPSGGAGQWSESCRTAERLGYDVIAVPDHLGVQSPFLAMVAAAAATERVRLTTFVLNSAFWNPVLLARDLLTAHELTGGRVEAGLGTGYVKAEFELAGLDWGTAGSRVGQLAETAAALRGLLAEPRAIGFARPAQAPPLLIGGNGDRVLRLAARQADIVSFSGAVLATGSNRGTLQMIDAEAMDERVAFFAAAAGPRDAQVERNVFVQTVLVTDDRRAAATTARRRLPYLGTEQILRAPTLLIGTAEEIAADLLARRERYGFSYVSVQERDMAAFAPVIALLAGR
ncbi:TIGR03621 family F420-dependent LLM class oxidoreductase [Kitasatospora sp. NBC_01250]|uniref:TIGR03621 family F420-dependent LLM class oxidoreductase n=1 Tax=unclassified Kitasatospora TaxID=2633591 RepID=UPI002E13378A|nr:MULTISPECIES: TIGR03621 family F420-dependent LLM class oxidoreductase [unclassified Kitasatospora]WSJ70755.1 TIGR03621 family F420-dependent LLM class oxidoreductase [Kitasatospora sp. NBC_01302]